MNDQSTMTDPAHETWAESPSGLALDNAPPCKCCGSAPELKQSGSVYWLSCTGPICDRETAMRGLEGAIQEWRTMNCAAHSYFETMNGAGVKQWKCPHCQTRFNNQMEAIG